MKCHLVDKADVPEPSLDLVTCVVAVTAAVLVAIARCTSCTLRLPD